LEEALKQFADKIYFVIEIKPLPEQLVENAISKLAALLTELKLFDSVVLASEEIKYLELLKNISDKKIYTAMVYTNKIDIDKNKKYYDSFVDACICSVNELQKTTTLLKELNNNIFVGVYGTRTLEDVLECVKYNVKVTFKTL
jgi:ribosome-interacting GTPase 1